MKKKLQPQFTAYTFPPIDIEEYYNGPKEVYEGLEDYRRLDRETMIIIYLNAKNGVLLIEVHNIGALNSAAVYPREIMKTALLNRANSIIMVHNHPSGEIEPSESDRQITKEVMSAARVLQIHLLDHIILGKDKFFSFADEGIITEMEIAFNLEFKNKN